MAVRTVVWLVVLVVVYHRDYPVDYQGAHATRPRTSGPRGAHIDCIPHHSCPMILPYLSAWSRETAAIGSVTDPCPPPGPDQLAGGKAAASWGARDGRYICGDAPLHRGRNTSPPPGTGTVPAGADARRGPAGVPKVPSRPGRGRTWVAHFVREIRPAPGDPVLGASPGDGARTRERLRPRWVSKGSRRVYVGARKVEGPQPGELRREPPHPILPCQAGCLSVTGGAGGSP